MRQWSDWYGLLMMRIASCYRRAAPWRHRASFDGAGDPSAATQDASSRLSQRTQVNAVVPLPAASGRTQPCRSSDPLAVCRYDLSAGTLELHAPLSQAYTSVTHVAYYAINDRAAGRHAIDLDLMTPEQRASAGGKKNVRRRPADRVAAESG